MLVDPNKCVIFNHSTLEEKKLKRLINLRDKCDDRYGILTLYSLIALLAVLVNALYLKHLALIPIALSIPLGIHLVGVEFLIYSKYLDKKTRKL